MLRAPQPGILTTSVNAELTARAAIPWQALATQLQCGLTRRPFQWCARVVKRDDIGAHGRTVLSTTRRRGLDAGLPDRSSTWAESKAASIALMVCPWSRA